MDKHEAIIISKLNELDTNYNTIKPFLKEYLIKIEEIIFEKENIQSESINTLKRNKFSTSSISDIIGCSRTTFYNYGAILNRYISFSEEKFKQNNPFQMLEDLRADKILIENQMKKMTEHDVDIEILSNEIDVHLNRIKEKNEEIKRLQERNAELAKENRELKKQVLKSIQISK